MDRDDIKKWQAKKIEHSLQPMVGYLFQLRHRMEKIGFHPHDPYYQLVCRAYDAVQVFWVQTHYLARDGAGRASEQGHDESPRADSTASGE